MQPLTRPCLRCRRETRVDRALNGYGRHCADLLGMVARLGRTRAARQVGPDLFSLLDVEPQDECDGGDRWQDRAASGQ